MAHLLPLVLRLGLLLALGLGDRSPLLPSLQKQEKMKLFPAGSHLRHPVDFSPLGHMSRLKTWCERLL